MYIDLLWIKRFGGLTDLELRLGAGVNIVEGANETGKTTVAAFIRYMLYGFVDEKERAFFCSEGEVAGALEITDGTNRCRIERETSPDGDEVRFFDMADDSPLTSADGSCVPGEMLLGVPVAVYDRTAFVGQSMGSGAEGGIGTAIDNLLFSGDESADSRRALEKLEAARDELSPENVRGGRLEELRAESEALKERLAAASQKHAEIFADETALAALERKITENRNHMTELEVRRRRVDDAVLARQYYELARLTKDAEDSKRAYEAAYADMTHNGFTPDRAYLSELKLVQAELDELNERLRDALKQQMNEEIVNGEATRYNFSPSAILEERGGEEAVTRELRGYHKRRTAASVFGGMLIGLCMMALFFGVLFLMMGQPKMWMLIGGVVLAAAGTAAVIYGVFQHRRESEILGLLGVSNVNEYLEYLTVWREQHRMQSSDAQKRGIPAKVQRLREAVRQKQNELRILAARWGSFPPDEIIEGVSASLDEVSGLYSAYKEAKERYETVQHTLDAYDREELLERVKNAPDEEELKTLNSENLRRELDFVRNAEQSMRDRQESIRQKLTELRASAEHPAKIAERIQELDAEIDSSSARADALRLACEGLNAASQSLHGSISPDLSKYAGEYLAGITDGKYDRLTVNSEMKLLYEDEDGVTREKRHLSAGTSDAAYISLRLALIRLLYHNLRPTLIFDESFAHLDDSRLARALAILRSAGNDGTQSVVFTSQRRDAETMRTIGEFKHIKL